MHILNGNVNSQYDHGSNPYNQSWKHQHKNQLSQSLSLATMNAGGLSSIIKKRQLRDLSIDVLGITETHLTSNLHQSTSDWFSQYTCIFSPDQTDRQFSGVCLLANKAAFWQIIPIHWKPDDACFQFHQDCRLVAAQVWLGNGGTSMLFYVIYGPSGARWEGHKRTYLNKLIDAVTEDAISRGQLPTVLLGDFNMQISESSKLQSLIRSRTWNNACDLASPLFVNAPTCQPGNRQGSQIDFIFTSSSICDQLFQYEVAKLDSFKDHSLVSIRLSAPAPVQTRCSLRAPVALPDLALPSGSDALLSCHIDSRFHPAIKNKNVNDAYKFLMQEISRVLLVVADSQHIQFHKHRAHRGNITFHEQRRHPKTVGIQASTLLTRKLWKAYNQATEVSKSRDGYKRSRTWLSLRSIIRYLPDDHLPEVVSILDDPASYDNALKLTKIFEQLLDIEEKQSRYNRIKSWKQKMRSNTSQ